MATWRPENSMLTQRGVEILNKLKAGVGSITVTRIVAGSGRVAESLLYQQTSISGIQKPMTISGKNTTDVGSEITFYIENKDFIEPYNLHQIGIYVTHPDYEGEQLYHISQCDANDYDTIPAISYTPVTQGYSIFMEHGNSSSVSITVDPSGMINTVQFNKFKESTEGMIQRIKTDVENRYTKLEVDTLLQQKVNTADFQSHATSNSNPHGVTAKQTGAIPASEKGAASGVATLGTDGKVPTGQLPSMNYAAKTHASQHRSGGSDPITPADIGAAPAYSYGTKDLTAGSSALETGKLYFVYE